MTTLYFRDNYEYEDFELIQNNLRTYLKMPVLTQNSKYEFEKKNKNYSFQIVGELNDSGHKRADRAYDM